MRHVRSRPTLAPVSAPATAAAARTALPRPWAVFRLPAPARAAAMAASMVLCAGPLAAQPERSPAPEGAYAYFISPAHGETVAQSFTVRFGLEGMGVAPAGVERANTGHHHLLINLEEPPRMDRPLPANDQVQHFGGGQTQTTLRLEPGQHTLQLLLGDHTHTPHAPPVLSEKITITVRPDPVPEDDEKGGKLPRLF